MRLVMPVLLVLRLAACPAPAGADIPSFFGGLCAEHEAMYVGRHTAQYLEFCGEFAAAPADPSNRRVFATVGLVHELLTGAGAVDCARGGALEIPYFWHWVDPNPRHSIVLLPDSVSLSSVAPPPDYARYRNFADVDRTPSLFLSDVASESPRYWHEDCGRFYTFGWCSEREMAYLALMTCLGYEGRIRQEGIHSWTELWCSLVDGRGRLVDVVASVDNTFGTLEWKSAPTGVPREAWLRDVGSGREVRWYNAEARSAQEHARLRDTEVPPVAAARITEQVRQWLTSDVRGER